MTIIGGFGRIYEIAFTLTTPQTIEDAEQGARQFVVAGNEIFGLTLKVRELILSCHLTTRN